MNPKLWPNLVTGLRIALMPAVLTVAFAGSRFWFVALLATSLATDALDGFLARRLNAYSPMGRRLDSIADYVMLLTGVASIALLWPEHMRVELPWVAAGLGAFVSVLLFGYLRVGRPLQYHTWLTKAMVPLLALSLIPLLNDWSAAPFHVVIVLEFVSVAEQVSIALAMPWLDAEVPSLWHALRLRRERLTLPDVSRAGRQHAQTGR